MQNQSISPNNQYQLQTTQNLIKVLYRTPPVNRSVIIAKYNIAKNYMIMHADFIDDTKLTVTVKHRETGQIYSDIYPIFSDKKL